MDAVTYPHRHREARHQRKGAAGGRFPSPRRHPLDSSARLRGSPRLAGIAEREAGVASGLLNTSQQLGGAIGVAIASTVAAAHTKTLLADGHATNAALTGGFQWAFWVCGAIALLALPTTAVLLRRSRRDQIEGAIPAPLEAGRLNRPTSTVPE